MTSIGTGYDLSCTTFSPDGRVFQVEYASKAVENSGTAIGVRVSDGIVMGIEKLVVSKMLEIGANRRVHSVDRHSGLCSAGLIADARQLVNRARAEAKQYKNFYHEAIPGKVLAERLAGFVQAYTLYANMRPFCASVILGTYDRDGPQLHMIEPSGHQFGYFATAIGKGKQAAKGELEKLKLSDLTCKQALKEVAKVIYSIHDDVKDKDFELELSWICKESNYEHQLVPKDLLIDAEKFAKSSLQEDMED